DVEHLDLQRGARLAIHDEVGQPAPGPLQLLEVGVVQDGGQLLGQRLVDGLHARLDRARDVLVKGEGPLHGLIDQGGDQLLGAVALGLRGDGDHLVERDGVGGGGGRGRRGGGGLFGGTHGYFPPSGAASAGALAPSSAASFFWASVFCRTCSSMLSRSVERSTLVRMSRSRLRVSS